MPKTRQITRWLLSRPAALDAGEQAQLTAILARCPHPGALAGHNLAEYAEKTVAAHRGCLRETAHVRAFAEMMTGRQGQHLQAWLADVEADDQPQRHSLAAGVRRDLQAVTSGLTLPYSSGVVEGNASRIKMIKRQMYGRASLALLRKRVLLAG